MGSQGSNRSTDPDITIKGSQVTFGDNKLWISTRTVSSAEYNGTFIVPVSEMSNNISCFEQYKDLQSALAKYQYAIEDKDSDGAS